MSKTLDVVMAGVIAGIVAFTTSKLGIGGTVIGSVLGVMLYQILSHFIRDPLGRVKTQKIETRIVYSFPLIIILVIEVIYVLSFLFVKPHQIFYFLEGATGWNLFRSIGLGLLFMGIYPIIESENIKKLYGYILLTIGIIKLLQGFADIEFGIIDPFSDVFYRFSIIISLIVVAGLLFVIISLIRESIEISYENKQTTIDKWIP
jgi:hypothetical protein